LIELFYFPTPNCHKITVFLEEAEVEYRITPVFITKGDQFKVEFLANFPNNRIPAIVDHAPRDGGEPISIFESGAILQYLGDKTGRFLPTDQRGRYEVLKWLFWQVAGLGPVAGQTHHFRHYAPDNLDYAVRRFVDETSRLYAVLNSRLADRQYIAGDYSIADMACYPWIAAHEKQRQNLDDFSNVKRWFELINGRPAIGRAYRKGDEIEPNPAVTEASKKFLFGQSAETVRRALTN
jgi:GST-like protein